MLPARRIFFGIAPSLQTFSPGELHGSPDETKSVKRIIAPRFRVRMIIRTRKRDEPIQSSVLKGISLFNLPGSQTIVA